MGSEETEAGAPSIQVQRGTASRLAQVGRIVGINDVKSSGAPRVRLLVRRHLFSPRVKNSRGHQGE